MPERSLGYDIDALFEGNGEARVGGTNFNSGSTPSFQSSFYGGVGAGVLADGDLVSNIQQRAGTIYNGKASFSDTTAGYMLGVDTDGELKFIIGDASSSMDWNVTAADTLTIAGTISATTGDIGGFDIGADYIRDAGNSFGLASTVSGSDDVRFWAGDSFANRGTADFRVTEAGALTASSATITGAITIQSGSGVANLSDAGDLAVLDDIDLSYVTDAGALAAEDSVTPALADISLQGWTYSGAFSSSDKDTVAWAVGTLTNSAGTSYSISGSNTGNMASRTYIYFDAGVSTTAFQTTTTVATAVGTNKILIAVAQNGSAQASFQVYGGIGGLKLPASQTSISNNNWVFSGTWTLTDLNTVTWGAGTLTTSDGGAYSISGSNTGNMAAKTYIYFDLGVSSTAFQTTTTRATAVGDGKILIAIAENGATEPTLVVVNDDRLNIDAANIVAGSITATEISAGAITATKIDVDELSAISADMGTIIAGTVTGATLRTASSGTRFSMTSSAFQGINASGSVVFEIVLSGNVGDVILGDDATGNYAIWDNSAGTFSVFADNVPTTSQGTFGGDGSDGALTITSGTTTVSCGSAATLTKNYTAISISSTGELAFSNPHANGTIVILKSQGAVTLTSTAPSIDLRTTGAAGGATDTDGNEPTGLFLNSNTPAGQVSLDNLDGGLPGSRYDNPGFYTTTEAALHRRALFLACGAGGGGGVSNGADAGGAGGRGGGALLIECAGALNFTGSINSSGSDGAAPVPTGTNESPGAGGGGSAGIVVILYTTLTSAAGTITASGGAGAATPAGAGTTGDAGSGGGGAGSVAAAGGEGGQDGDPNGDAAGGVGAGGGGARGDSLVGGAHLAGAAGASMGGLVAQNKYFA